MSVPVLALAVSVADLGWQVTTTNYPGHEGHKFAQQTVVLDTGRVRYAVKYCSDIDPSLGEGRAWPTEGYIGMPMPTSENWYHSGFLFVRFNGVDIGSYRVKAVRVVETGERGAVDFFWDAKPGLVRVRFLALPGDDKLLCEVALQPQIPVTEFTVRLQALPCYRTSLTVAPGRRKVVTPVRELLQPESEGPVRVESALDPQRENWLLLCDEVFDRAKGRGFGPCALLFLPEQIRGAKVVVTHFFVTVRLDVRPYLGRARLAIWEVQGLSNRAALSRLRGEATPTLSLLRRLSFLPPSLEGFDEEGAEAEVERVLSRLRDWPPAMELRLLPREIASLLPEVVRAAKSGWPDIPRELEAVLKLKRLRELLREARRLAELGL